MKRRRRLRDVPNSPHAETRLASPPEPPRTRGPHDEPAGAIRAAPAAEGARRAPPGGAAPPALVEAICAAINAMAPPQKLDGNDSAMAPPSADDRGEAPCRRDESLPAVPSPPPPAVEAWDLAAAPYWTPPGVVFDRWPRELRAAIVDVINPAYFELVMRAEPGLAQSTGLTIVHLMWLEILEQLKAANEPEPVDMLDRLNRESRDAIILRHLQIVQSKLKASEFLLRLKEFRREWSGSGQAVRTTNPQLESAPAGASGDQNSRGRQFESHSSALRSPSSGARGT